MLKEFLFLLFLYDAASQSCTGVQEKIDCGFPTIDESKCRDMRGCCWERVDPNPNDIPFCFFENDPSIELVCDPQAVKQECGDEHIPEADCLRSTKQCCWEETADRSIPFCFTKTRVNISLSSTATLLVSSRALVSSVDALSTSFQIATVVTEPTSHMLPVSTFIAPTSSAVDFSLSTSSLQQSSLNLQSSTFSQHASPLYSSFQTPSLAPTSSLAPTPSLVPTSSFPLIPVILAVFGLIVILITILFLLGCVCCLKQRAKYRSLGPPQAQVHDGYWLYNSVYNKQFLLRYFQPWNAQSFSFELKEADDSNLRTPVLANDEISNYYEEIHPRNYVGTAEQVPPVEHQYESVD